MKAAMGAVDPTRKAAMTTDHDDDFVIGEPGQLGLFARDEGHGERARVVRRFDRAEDVGSPSARADPDDGIGTGDLDFADFGSSGFAVVLGGGVIRRYRHDLARSRPERREGPTQGGPGPSLR